VNGRENKHTPCIVWKKEGMNTKEEENEKEEEKKKE